MKGVFDVDDLFEAAECVGHLAGAEVRTHQLEIDLQWTIIDHNIPVFTPQYILNVINELMIVCRKT